MSFLDPSELPRLEALARYDIAGTPPEAAFDDLARLAQQICETPQAYVTFVDVERVWFKAAIGLHSPGVPRDASICTLMLSERGPMEVRDTAADSRTRELAAVTQGGIRFYSGVPLMTQDGYILGSLCVTDSRPRELSPAQRESLLLLGRQVVAQLELRRQTAELRATDRERAENAARLRVATEAAQLGIFVWHIPEDRVTWENEQVYREFGRTPEDGTINAAEFAEKILHPDDRAAFEGAVAKALSGEAPFHFQGRFFRKDGELRWIELRGQITRDAAGAPLWMLGTTADITARMQTEARLRRAHDTFLRLVESAPFGVIVVDSDFRLVQVSRGAREVFAGVHPLLDRDYAEVMRVVWPEPFATKAISRFRHTLETGEPYISSAEEQRADRGQVESYDWRLERIELPEGGLCVVCYFYETTQVRRAERALRASEARFRAAVSAVSSLIWTNNCRGEMEGEQPGWGSFTGQTQEEYQGYGWSKAVHPEDAQPTIDAWNQAVADRRMFVFEHRVRRRDGEWRRCSVRAVPVLDLAGAITEWVGVHTDITEVRAAEAALRESESLFRHIADVAPAMTWMVDPQMNCTFLSRSWYEYTGMPPGSGLGIGWIDTVHPEDREAAARAFYAAAEKRESIFFDYRVRRADGEYRWAIDAARPRFGPDGEYLGLVGNVFDIHERKTGEDALREAKEQAESASRAKDDFLAALSHELRTPLTPVLMSAAALREDESLPAHVRDELAMIERNVTLEARLIDDLLDLTRIARGKLALRGTACDIHSLLSLAAQVVRDEAREKQITIKWDLAAERTHLTGDPARLQQVFWNLLRNAVKFTPSGGTVRIRSAGTAASTVDGRLLVEVSDTGIGFAPAAAERIFAPFEQAGREGDHRFGGLGLGLAIARAVVEMHGGIIRAASEGPGRGATFTVELPGAQATSAVASLPGPGPASRDGASERALRLLVVEDHAPTLAVLTRLLARDGHTVVAVGTIADARAVAETQHFDGVISDLGLPDGTGLELMSELRTRHGLRGVMLSGYGMEDDQRRSRDAGFIAHLVKPVDFTQLRHALREFASPVPLASADAR